MERLPESEYANVTEELSKKDKQFKLPIIFTLLQHRPADEVFRVRKTNGGSAIFIQTQIWNQAYFCTYGDDESEAIEAGVELIKALPTDRERMFSSMIERDQDIVRKNYGAALIDDELCYAWHYPVESIGRDAAIEYLNRVCYGGDTATAGKFSLRKLDAEDARIVDLKWPHRGANGAYEFIRSLVMADTPASSSGFGGWGVVDNENKRLMAWGLQYDSGAIGFIHVEPEYRRRGIGRLILSRLTLSAIEQSDVPPFVFTVAENEGSKAMFTSEKWVNDGPVRWVLTPNAY